MHGLPAVRLRHLHVNAIAFFRRRVGSSIRLRQMRTKPSLTHGLALLAMSGMFLVACGDSSPGGTGGAGAGGAQTGGAGGAQTGGAGGKASGGSAGQGSGGSAGGSDATGGSGGVGSGTGASSAPVASARAASATGGGTGGGGTGGATGGSGGAAGHDRRQQRWGRFSNGRHRRCDHGRRAACGLGRHGRRNRRPSPASGARDDNSHDAYRLRIGRLRGGGRNASALFYQHRDGGTALSRVDRSRGSFLAAGGRGRRLGHRGPRPQLVRASDHRGRHHPHHQRRGRRPHRRLDDHDQRRGRRQHSRSPSP